MQFSIVIPCLNEHETLATVLEKASLGLSASQATGEIIVSDNGSTDGSIEIARAGGARVVHASKRGYGNALQAGIEAAQGRWIVMGDADDSYDFREIPKFVAPLEAGADLVMGCRLPSGGGTIAPGAMPITHRLIGNPGFSFLARWWFNYPGHDVYCGLRAFKKELVEDLKIKSPGMEFAVEMVLKSAVFGKRISEVPITLHKDGRVKARPHLRTVRDGWRTLRLFLAFSPKSLFLWPAMALLLFGVLGYAVSLPGLTIGPATFDVHTLLIASLGWMLGLQMFTFALAAQIGATSRGLQKRGRADKLLDWLPFERVLLVATLLTLIGLGWIAALAAFWLSLDFGRLDYALTMRQLIPAVTTTATGAQLFFGVFFLDATRSWRDYAEAE
jgi:glycosyltransferase involved in cell wall biosynthesis